LSDIARNLAKSDEVRRVRGVRDGRVRRGHRHGFGYNRAAVVRIERDGPVTTVILDRPAVRNAVDRATATSLADAFRAFDADPDARVAVLHGDHGTFCAGADLKALAGGAGSAPTRVAPDGDGPMGPSRMVLGKPVIAAISGHAVAGGLELALWCDLRVADEDAVLGVFCRRFGVPLIDGGTIRLPRLIGLSRALDLILTGRPVHADEALAIGLVNRVVPHGEALSTARQLAHALALLPQAALRADRMSAYVQHDLSLEAALARELELGSQALAEGLSGAQQFAQGAGRHGGST
jgi:enoyl-CoA hydratase